jgi:5-methyltetrahydrofolate--homocysteine methyltransferase
MNKKDILTSLQEAMIDLDESKAMDLARQALSNKIEPYEITNTLSGGLKIIGDQFAVGTCFIPELIKSGKIFEKIVALLEPESKGKQVRDYKGKVVVGTVKGDLHDLGLKLVSMTLSIDGFDVTNLGKDVSVEVFIEKVKELNPNILGLSALLTTTLNVQRDVIQALQKHKLRDKVKVMIGGAPVTQEWSDAIGADCVGFDAIDAVEKARTLI